MIDTLEIAKNDLRQGWKTTSGAICACCQQTVKLYNRKLCSTAAVGLIRLVRLYNGDLQYHHVTELGQAGSGGEFARLEHWGLIHPMINNESSKRCSGLWMPSLDGILFAYNKINVSSHLLIYNGKSYGLSEDKISIKQALGNKFDYQELMGKLL